MGSFFLHNDYRLPEINSFGVSKRDLNQPLAIFGKNPCFANIKKELGFYDEPDVPARNDNCNDIFLDSKARSSPVVERLILQEIQSDIAEHASALNIAIDPEQWTVEDTRKWLTWLSEQYQLPNNTADCLSFDGITVCSFAEQELILLTGSQDTGLKVAAQLDIWKNACRMVPSAGFYHFQQQQAMDSRFMNEPRFNEARYTNEPRCTENGYQKFMSPEFPWMVNESVYSDPQTSFNSFEYNRPFNYHMTNGEPYQQKDVSGTNYQMLGNRYLPRPTIQHPRFYEQMKTTYLRCQSTSSQADGFPHVGQQPVKSEPSRTQPYHNLDLKQYPQPEVPSTETNASPPEITPVYHKTAETVGPMTHKEQAEVGLEPYAECTETKLEPSNPQDESGIRAASIRRRTKHPIHLWEFLKELLREKRECIRWIDERKGVFKIYNSQEVAKVWGERKNRPAMNYDKLSRSIRQYYKKGIIKKTSQGKRLVYQFCESYL